VPAVASDDRKVVVAVMAMLVGIIVVVAVSLVLLSPGALWEHRNSKCGFTELSKRDVPVPDDFEVAANKTIEPYACGQPYARQAVLRGPAGVSGQRLRDRYTRALRADGWHLGRCQVPTSMIDADLRCYVNLKRTRVAAVSAADTLHVYLVDASQRGTAD
jgi:hypothetical protein